MKYIGNPLIVDLDGTLIHTDMLHESALKLLHQNILKIFSIIFWLWAGKAILKEKIITNIPKIDVTILPYNFELIEWLKLQKINGAKLVLCTASDISIAKSIADHLDIFEEVIASDGQINIAGKAKAELLTAKFGEKKFDYVGNSKADLLVWSQARNGIVINGSTSLIAKAKKLTNIIYAIPKEKISFRDWARVFRFHQWVKNLLIFIPLFAAHLTFTRDLAENLIFAFLSFNFCASSVYVTNDLLDLESDRKHPRKRYRPFASGKISISYGLIFSPLLLAASLLIGKYVNEQFFACLIFYFSLTCAYSLFLKRLVLVDCLTLAILYTVRIIAGAFAANVQLSFWLLTFSVFLFLSLAYIKRYAELHVHKKTEVEKIHGRGYLTSDDSLIQQFGVASGYVATLVLALYLNSANVIILYKNPEIIWAAVPMILLWLSRMWMQAHRGLMHDDPIIFAIKDKISLLIGICFITVFLLAALG